jgi:hypothetical protein
MEMLAWHCANVMNCWAGKGKSVSVEKLLPHLKKKRLDAQKRVSNFDTPPQSAEEAKARARKSIEMAELQEVWSDPEQAQILLDLGVEPPEGITVGV